jgi:small subunit ribosomal protein S19
MTRSLWKGPFSEIKTKNTKTKVWSRRSVILPYYLNKNFLVYNGIIFIPLTVSEEMIGHKFGEFSTTRKKPIHKIKKK